MKKMLLDISILLVVILFWSGCGSSSNDGVTPAPVTGTAFYVDSVVEGVTVTCGDVVSVTDVLGSFTYVEGQSCQFIFADILLREESAISQSKYIQEDVLRVAQFLLSLDNDNDPNNGIQLTSEVAEILKKEGITTVSSTDEELATLIVLLQNAGIGFGGEFVDSVTAQAHIDATRKALEGIVTNQPPVANAGDDFIVESGARVELDGSKSRDTDGEIVSYSWVEDTNRGNPRVGVKVEFANLPNGVHTFILTATDDKGATAEDEVVVTIATKVAEKITIPNSLFEAVAGNTLYEIAPGGKINSVTYNTDATEVTYSIGYDTKIKVDGDKLYYYDYVNNNFGAYYDIAYLTTNYIEFTSYNNGIKQPIKHNEYYRKEDIEVQLEKNRKKIFDFFAGETLYTGTLPTRTLVFDNELISVNVDGVPEMMTIGVGNNPHMINIISISGESIIVYRDLDLDIENGCLLYKNLGGISYKYCKDISKL